MKTMITENQKKLMIIEPIGPQGPKIGFQVSSLEDVEKFDTLVGKLPIELRKNLDSLRNIANEAGLREVKP